MRTPRSVSFCCTKCNHSPSRASVPTPSYSLYDSNVRDEIIIDAVIKGQRVPVRGPARYISTAVESTEVTCRDSSFQLSIKA